MKVFRFAFFGIRNIRDFGFTSAILEFQLLHQHQVDDCIETFTRIHRVLDNGYFFTKIIFQCIHGVVKIGAVMIKLVY